MIRKKIFKKKKSSIGKYYYLFIFLILILIIFILYYFILINKKPFFNITQNSNSFYMIPKDKGGDIIVHQDKKILNLTYKNKDNINLINDPSLEYSIQLYASDDYRFITNYRSKLISSYDSIFLPKDLLVVILKYELTSEYLLLFKNFNTRKKAFEYCEKYSYYLDKCIIVNAKNLD